MYHSFNCDIKEINLKDMNSIYTTDLFLYNIIINTDLGNLFVDNIRLIELFVKDKEHVIFKFINTNKYCRKDCKKFSKTYTQFDLFPTNKILHISYYGYFISGDESSKQVFETFEIDISNCFIMSNFLYFLYTKYKNIFK